MTSIHDLFRRWKPVDQPSPADAAVDEPKAGDGSAGDPEPSGLDDSVDQPQASGAAGAVTEAVAQDAVAGEPESTPPSTAEPVDEVPAEGSSGDAEVAVPPATSAVPAEPSSERVVVARSGPFAPEPDDPEPEPADPEPADLSTGDVVVSESAGQTDSGDRDPVEAEKSESREEPSERRDSSADGDAGDMRQPAVRVPEAGEWRGIVLVTGTDTDVGKTVVTSAIAAAAQAAGLRVAVVKPGQTGTAGGGPTDIDVVNRLASPDTTRTLASYPDPLAPLAAAQVASMRPLELYEVVDAVRAEAAKHDLVLVEGAGGLLVPMGVRPSGEAWTFADLATTLGVSVVVVTRAGLGTLNHTALTLEALARRGVPAGVILGAWPAEPELVHWANLSELVPHMVGALPDGAGSMDPGVFRRSAPGWLTPALYGVLDDWRVWADESADHH